MRLIRLFFLLVMMFHSLAYAKHIQAGDIDMLLASSLPGKQWQIHHPARTQSHRVIIVVDPGHGGKDPGAISNHGIEEKNIVLSIAKKLVTKLNQTPHIHAILTRQNDSFLTLRERLMFARKHHADLFISIHADSYFDTSIEGATVYALSERGATTVAARWLAQRQNHPELGHVAFASLQDQSPVLRSVLIDLAQTATNRASLRLGHQLLTSLNTISALQHSIVEQAPFFVLKSPDIPSVLVETGFITNHHEEKRLANNHYQQKLANALYTGIVHYIKQYA